MQRSNVDTRVRIRGNVLGRHGQTCQLGKVQGSDPVAPLLFFLRRALHIDPPTPKLHLGQGGSAPPTHTTHTRARTRP